MIRLFVALALLVPATSATGAPRVRSGFAVRHNSLARVAAVRGMDSRGVLFASPLYPIGTRMCVKSARITEPICGVVVDVPQPAHYAWQLAERRYVEVSQYVANLLCIDPTGLPSQCPVTVWRSENDPRMRVRNNEVHTRGQSTYRPKVGRRMGVSSRAFTGGLP